MLAWQSHLKSQGPGIDHAHALLADHENFKPLSFTARHTGSNLAHSTDGPGAQHLWCAGQSSTVDRTGVCELPHQAVLLCDPCSGPQHLWSLLSSVAVHRSCL
eukprot:3644153-Amphidinium_carterae.1